MDFIKGFGMFIASCSLASLLWVNDLISLRDGMFTEVYAGSEDSDFYERRLQVEKYMNFLTKDSIEYRKLRVYINLAREQGYEPDVGDCFELEEICFGVLKNHIVESNVRGESLDNIFSSWFNSACFWKAREFASKEDPTLIDVDRALFYLAIVTHQEVLPMNPDAHYMRGKALERVNNLEKALEEYRIASNLLPLWYRVPERLSK